MKKLLSILGIIALVCLWMAKDAEVKEDIKTIVKGTVKESRELVYSVEEGWQEGKKNTEVISDTTVVE